MRESRSTVQYKLELLKCAITIERAAHCTVVRSPASLKRLAQERSMYSNLREMENANQMTWELFLCILKCQQTPHIPY